MAPSGARAAADPFAIGTFSPTADLPSVAVDPNGTGYVAWIGEDSLLHYCELPDGATACAASGTLSPGPAAASTGTTGMVTFAGTPKVVDADGVVSIIVQTTTNVAALDQYAPIEMWQAPDDTANFEPVDGGESVADPSATRGGSFMGYATTVPGTGELGVSFFTPNGPPSFQAFTVHNPPACSYSTSPGCSFATLQTPGSADPVGNFGFGQFVAQVATASGANPGVLGLYATSTATGPFACTLDPPDGDNFSDAYTYASGLESATDDYNIPVGQPDSAWKVAATQVPSECPIQESVIGAGPSGAGLLESSNADNGQPPFVLSYHPFDSATGAFDQPAVNLISGTISSQITMSQDGSGGIYVTGYLGGGDALSLLYSADGGETWQGPAPVETDLLANPHACLTRSAPTGRAGWSPPPAAPCTRSSSPRQR
jgi:hypothetical protein